MIVFLAFYHLLRLFKEYKTHNDASTIFAANAITSVSPDVGIIAKSLSVGPTVSTATEIVASSEINNEEPNNYTSNAATTVDILKFTGDTDEDSKILIKNVKMAHICTFLCMIFYTICNVMLSLIQGAFDYIESSKCSLIYKLFIVSFLFGKLSLYSVFVLRLKIAYSNTINKYMFGILYGILFSYAALILLAFIEISRLKTNDFWNDNNNICFINTFNYGLLTLIITSMYLMDVILQCFYVGLFLKPLLKTHKQAKFNQARSRGGNDDNNDDDIDDDDGIATNASNIMVKYGLMTSLTVLTSLISFYLPLVPVDNFINCLFIVLMSSIHNKFYSILCGVPHAKCQKCCF